VLSHNPSTVDIPYQNTALLAETTDRLLRAVSDAVIFVREPKNKELVLKSLSKGLRLPGRRMHSAVTTGSRICTSGASIPVDGIRSTIRFLGPGNEKIRALKAENLIDDRFVKKLEQEGRF
jgi:hypothetical protein